MSKYVYRFSKEETDGNSQMRNILGGKGAGLAEMCRLGVPVPPGFTISTESCVGFMRDGDIDAETKEQVVTNLAWLENLLEKKLDGTGVPLLLSVRSGARVSMPGMMDTILNLGLNHESVERLAEHSGDRRFALDSFRRFIQMYGNVVLGIDSDEFERLLEAQREKEGVSEDWQISEAGLSSLIDGYQEQVLDATGKPFPMDPKEQLWGAIRAVFKSWTNDRARFYRKINHIPDDWGTAVNVQSMVFGNMGEASGTGVCFSRNPSNGENLPYGEFLCNAQGEDVVAGIRTPDPIVGKDNPRSMETRLPETFRQFIDTVGILEKHFRDMQDVEFTFENGRLFLLQTRSGKRTSQAGLRIAIDMCREGLISERDAVQRIEPESMAQLLASEFDQDMKQTMLRDGKLLAKGLNAGPGAATGKIVLDAERAVELKEAGISVILVRAETSPEDIAGMHASAGILTQRGGMTSHAAVVARGMGKPCVVGCAEMHVDYKGKKISFGDKVFREGDHLSIDGYTGEVINGSIDTRESSLIQQLKAGNPAPDSQAGMFLQLMNWVDKCTDIGVRANADTPQDAATARLLGAQGIGLCRTEHMFFGEDRILHVRKMILAADERERESALKALHPFQMDDFYHLFKEMDGLPVTIRLLDPPLHEFLPQTEAQINELAVAMRLDPKAVHARTEELEESNPMLGHRGCRLGITTPEIYLMQVRAIVDAVKKASAEGIDARPEIMVPLIGSKKELEAVKASIEPVIEEAGLSLPIGTMIEIPRAALTADEIAPSAAFFSFGTNDLTQCGLGISRDDSNSFLPFYQEKGIMGQDPFKSIDQNGIGKLVKMGVELGTSTNPDLKLGVCGEHGGDPRSIEFFRSVGLHYVSCSPYRVPVARLAGAKASIEVNH